MSTFNDISGLMKYVGRDDWPEHLDEVLEEHFGAAMDIFQIEYADMPYLIGDHWMSTLWGCAFEDLLTRSVGPDRLNIVDVFLKRRGWNEKVQNKTYMRALRDSVMSLYEISGIVPGTSLLARDLLRGGEPVRVRERSATQSLKQWDKLAARIVPIGDSLVLAGGALAFSAEAAAAAAAAIRGVINTGTSHKDTPVDDATLRKAAPLFTNTWLIDVLSQTIGKKKKVLQNSAGEDVLFHTIRFPIAKGSTQKDIAARLDKIDCLHRESASFWNWLGGPESAKLPAAKAPNGLVWNVTMDDGSVVLGNVELEGRFLTLMVNSAGRAADGRAMLHSALTGLLGKPLTEIRTAEQMMATRPAREPQKEVSVEVATPLVHEMLDKHYRAILDEPVGVLGDISPRAAIRTAEGREKVADWLKYLENSAANHDNPLDPVATYDCRWLWQELNIEALRK